MVAVFRLLMFAIIILAAREPKVAYCKLRSITTINYKYPTTKSSYQNYCYQFAEQVCVFRGALYPRPLAIWDLEWGEGHITSSLGPIYAGGPHHRGPHFALTKVLLIPSLWYLRGKQAA